MLSIIIITLNEENRIANLLEDLKNQTYRDFEIILVDSNSNDNTVSIAETFKDKLNIKTHVMSERGVSLGRNTGAKFATNERLLFLDADVRLNKNFLSNAIDYLERKDLEVAGVYMGAEGLEPLYKMGYTLFNIGLFTTSFFFPTAVGACIFSTKTAHKRVNGFDQEIILCEDCDYVNKLSKTYNFKMIPVSFNFDPRRLKQDGFFNMGFTYLKANVRRFFLGEMRKNEIEYKFGHYEDQK
jgi:glycosyltransferase involved in cell wall biosynthesis